jgi:hypothetical protein
MHPTGRNVAGVIIPARVTLRAGLPFRITSDIEVVKLQDLDEHLKLQCVALRVDNLARSEEERWHTIDKWLHRLRDGATKLHWNELGVQGLGND